MKGTKKLRRASKMSIEIDHSVVWRPAAEVLAEDEEYERQLEAAIQAHNKALFKGASCYYTETVYPRGGEPLQPPLFDVKDYSEEKWRQEQGFRVLAPVGTRILLRRRIHASIIQDTMMIRVEQPYLWECLHVFYTQTEGTPLPLHTKKRKYY